MEELKRTLAVYEREQAKARGMAKHYATMIKGIKGQIADAEAAEAAAEVAAEVAEEPAQD